MLSYIARRILNMIPVIFILTIVSFVIIQLPPGDAISRYLQRLTGDRGLSIEQVKQLEAMRERHGLTKPIYVRYFRWMGKFLRGDLGYSFDFRAPVAEVLPERLFLTLIITTVALLFSWIVAFPIGIYSAIKQHTAGDYIFTFMGFLGLAIPGFMLALMSLYFMWRWFGFSFIGLFSYGYHSAPWSLARFFDLMKNVWFPAIIVGAPGTAGLIRIMRNNLLDELQKPYVTTARAKGLREVRLLFKYPIRIAINPFLSTVGWLLPETISASIIVETVLNLQTTGQLLLRSLLFQDMELAGAIIMILALFTVVGTLISDILLAAVDPRIRYS